MRTGWAEVQWWVGVGYSGRAVVRMKVVMQEEGGGVVGATGGRE